jgi:F0F1-type ATP synthase membrane subunit c/vacuolar-type H+-ATPase subunit K
MEFNCPKCQSDNIQRLSVIFEGGLSDINTKTHGTGVGVGRGGLGVGFGSAKTSGTAQTAASKRASPPAKKEYLKPIFGIFVLCVLVTLVGLPQELFIFTWLAISGWWAYTANKYNSETWPPLFETWSNSYLCNRCNEIFTIE